MLNKFYPTYHIVSEDTVNYFPHTVGPLSHNIIVFL